MNKRPHCFITPGYVNGGFTLIELLLVVLIIGIMAVLGVNVVNSQSIERSILNRAQQFESDIKFVCEKAILENQIYGVEWSQNNYHVLKYQMQTWHLVDAQVKTEIPTSIKTDLLINGLKQNFKSEPENSPHIICQSDGSFNAFEIRFSDAALVTDVEQAQQIYYALSTDSPWQLKGAWHQ